MAKPIRGKFKLQVVKKPKALGKRRRAGKKRQRPAEVQRSLLIQPIVVLRHSQRVDRVEALGPNWVAKATRGGRRRYQQYDSNLVCAPPLHRLGIYPAAL